MGRSIWRHGIIHAVALGSIMATVLVASSAGAAAGPPSAPRAVQANGAATTISVSWKKPAVRGADAVRDYVVTSHPLSKTCATRTTTCEVKGLKPGATYTFSVVAKNGVGTSVSAASNRIEVATAGAYFVSTVSTYDAIVSAAQSDLVDANTTAGQQAGIDAFSDALEYLVGNLDLEQWPASSSGAVSTFITDTRQFSSSIIDVFEASSPSIAATDLSISQGASNTEVFAESAVLSDLGEGTTVIVSNAATPTPVALDTPQTVTDLFGDQVSVSASQVIDPATAATGSGLADAGYRFVAIDLDITNEGANTVTGNANFSTSVVGSDGNTYNADYGTVAECSNFTYGEFQVPLNDSASGCVVFELPTNVTVQSISFSLAPTYLDTAEWTSQ